MLNRRLVVLFFVVVAGFCILALRLGHMQITEAESWREELQAVVHRRYPIETTRGTIYDRQGVALARDVPCYDLAIDYRAMNLDERWVQATAQARLDGEKVEGRAARVSRLEALELEIAGEIDREPEEIAQVCHLSKDEVLGRYNDIRDRIRVLKQDRWSQAFDKDAEKGDSGDGSGDGTDEGGTAAAARPEIVLREEIEPHTVVPNIPDDVSFYFQQNKEKYPGIVVIDSRRREYPYKDVACQVIGNLRSVSKPALDADTFAWPDMVKGTTEGNLHGYLQGDLMGENGVEKLMEGVLRGTRGEKLKDLSVSGDEEEKATKRIEPAPGGDVQLTLDIGMQAEFQAAVAAKHLLKGQDGKDHFAAVVVMSMDGQVLMMWSSENYDLNQADALRGELQNDVYRRRLANRTLQAYQPGSTIKPLVASGALMEGVINDQTTITCNGYLFPGRPNVYRCSIWEETNGRASHGPLQVVGAIEESCNIFFYTVGRDMGVERLHRWFDNFGLGRDSGFELPEQDGAIPSLRGANDSDAATSEALQLGIGQGPVAVTPMQMAAAYATLLKGGEPVVPHILAKGEVRAEDRRMTLSPEVEATVRRGMEDVVTGPLGTAAKPFAGMRLKVGGKTGSATAWQPAFDDEGNPVWDTTKPVLMADGKPKLGPDGAALYRQASEEGTHAWFMGYAPADHPQYIVASIMEFGGHGGVWAAPMAKEAILGLERHGYLPAVDVEATRGSGDQ